jgi:hypothetical protein
MLNIFSRNKMKIFYLQYRNQTGFTSTFITLLHEILLAL